MEENRGQMTRSNQVTICDRKRCSLNGIVDVIAFDLHEILLETDLGMLMIKGDKLHVNRLTVEKGEIDVEGQIDSLTYSDSKCTHEKGESLLSRMFR